MNHTSRIFGSRRRFIAVSLALIGVVGTILVMALSRPNAGRASWPESFTSSGEQLYFTGRGSSGSRMMPQGGNHHMTMMGSGGCVDCHGADRKGGRLWPTFWQVAPSIAALDLAGDHGHDGHSHEGYTPETLAVAITDGLRPDGSALRRGMPRWTLSPADLTALTGYLLAH